jgi:serine-type D-Ala-D-Ala carboxypeptidase (penicillin-binding protein 5/6)
MMTGGSPIVARATARIPFVVARATARISFVAARVAARLLFVAALAAPWPAGALETIAGQAILIDAQTDTVLLEKSGFDPMPPASMSKLMTVYMVFDRLKDGRLSLDDTFRVSRKAWEKGGAKSGSSTMFLEPGSRVKVEDLLRGIIVQSGNDACIVVAEGLAGSEDAFAEQMTKRADELGMRDSYFTNATGWPDPDHLMTPWDLAHLARRTIEDFPEYYHLYSERSFTYNKIRQSNRNPLLYKKMGADGLKTGHTKASGYGLVASAVRGKRRLILVVNGLPSKKARSSEPERLLDWGFRHFKNYALFKAGEEVERAEVWLGEKPKVPLVLAKDLIVSVRRNARKQMKVKVTYEGPIPAPIAAGTKVATLTVEVPGVETKEVPLLAGADITRLGVMGRMGEALKYYILGGLK